MKAIAWLCDECNAIRRCIQKSRYTPLTFAEHLRHCGAQVGHGCWIASMRIEVGIEAYLVKVGNRVAIASDVAFITHDGAAWVFRHRVPDLQVYGPIIIEDDCLIGRGAILCPGVHIGPNAVVAAGALVISDVPPHTWVAGVPARVCGSAEEYRNHYLARPSPGAVPAGAFQF